MPRKSKTIKCRNHLYKPWISPGILKSIRKKNKLYKASLHESSNAATEKYKRYKNKLNKIIHKAEKLYYLEKFNMAQGNLNKTWQIIKKID
jgi:hypothetical protein